MATKKEVKKVQKPLTEKTTDELKADLIVAQTDLVAAKRSHAARELANTARIKELRVTIARIKTALSSQTAENKENA